MRRVVRDCLTSALPAVTSLEDARCLSCDAALPGSRSVWGQLDEASKMIITDLKTMWHIRLAYLYWGVLRGQRCSRGAAARRCTPKDAATPLWPPHWLQTPPASPVETDISMKPCKSIEENVEGCAAATRIEALYSTGHANSAHKNLLLAKSSTRRQKSKGRQSAGGVSSVSTSSTREA